MESFKRQKTMHNADNRHPTQDNPKSLKPAQWDKLLNQTGVLKGWKPSKASPSSSLDLKQAPEPALQLSPGAKVNFSTDYHAYYLTKEHSARIERRLLEQAFTTNSIETSIKGGIPNLALGLKNHETWTNLFNTESVNRDNSTSVFHKWVEPRVALDLSALSLVPSESLIRFTRNWNDKTYEVEHMLEAFHEQFGTIFATKVWLGGCIRCVEENSASYQMQDQKLQKGTAVEIGAEGQVGPGEARLKYGWDHEHSAQRKAIAEILARSSDRKYVGPDSALTNSFDDWFGALNQHDNWKPVHYDEVTPVIFLVRDVLSARGTNFPGAGLIDIMEYYLRKQQRTAVSGVPLSLEISFSKRGFSLKKLWTTRTFDPDWIAVIDSAKDSKHIVKGVRIITDQLPQREASQYEPVPCPFDITDNVRKIKDGSGNEEFEVDLKIMICLQEKWEWIRRNDWNLPESSSAIIYDEKTECLLWIKQKIKLEQKITCAMFAK